MQDFEINNQRSLHVKHNRKDFLRVSDVAEMLGVSRKYIYHLKSLGGIPYIKKGKLLFFVRKEIENWLLEGGTNEPVAKK